MKKSLPAILTALVLIGVLLIPRQTPKLNSTWRVKSLRPGDWPDLAGVLVALELRDVEVVIQDDLQFTILRGRTELAKGTIELKPSPRARPLRMTVTTNVPELSRMNCVYDFVKGDCRIACSETEADLNGFPHALAKSVIVVTLASPSINFTD